MNGRIDQFDADFNTALAWKRLESGKFNDLDLKLLSHEHFESRFEGIFHANYKASHEAANRSGRFSGQNIDEAEKYVESSTRKGRFDKVGDKNGSIRSVRKNRRN